MMVALALVLVAFAYLLFVCASIGLHERLWLAFGPISREDSRRRRAQTR